MAGGGNFFVCAYVIGKRDEYRYILNECWFFLYGFMILS